MDRSLDDMISEKRASRPHRQRRDDVPTQKERVERQAPARRDQPYARPPPRSTEDKWVHDAYNGPARRQAGGYGNGGQGYAAPVQFTGLSPRIEVTNIHYEVTPTDLKGIFNQAGTIVTGPTLRYDRSGRSTGHCTIEYASPQQAKIAINKFDGAMTKGQTISIRLLPPHRGPPAGAMAPNQAAASNGSLLSRMGGGSLASRVGPAPGQANKGQQDAQRGARPASRARGASGPKGRGARPARQAPATADDLDKAMDAYMKPAADKSGDVTMA